MKITRKNFSRNDDSGMKTFFIYGEPEFNEHGIDRTLVDRIIDIRFNSVYEQPAEHNKNAIVHHTVERPETYTSFEEWRAAIKTQYNKDKESRKRLEEERISMRARLDDYFSRTFMKIS